jgi:HSP20 family molecular chaperone IbpA
MAGKEQVRTFSLSKSADVDGVTAVVKNGYLTVTIPGISGKTPTRKVSVG